MPPEEFWESDRVITRVLDPSPAAVEVSFLETVAEVEGCDVDDLPRLWPALGSVLERGFATPPADATELRLEFTYAGYRVRLDRTGHATLVKLPDH